jgi:hypothetical protein
VTKLREAKLQERQDHNDLAVAEWSVESLDGWGNTPPTSPVQEGWLGVPADANQGTWPLLSDVVPLRPDGWPDLLPQVSDGVRVTIEVVSSIGSIEGHSTCRLLVVIGCFSVPDLLSPLCHSTIGTSVRSCARYCTHGGVDEIIACREHVA